MYKISIIVPVFNVEDTLESAFDSIYNQNFNFEELEIIFIDDYSSDSSGKLIDEYSQKYDNVKVIHLDQNSGYAGKPRNIGIDAASADYIMFLDPDDEFTSDACLILYDLINSHDFDLVSGNYTITTDGVEKKYNGYERLNLKDNLLQIDSIDQDPNLFTIPPSVWCKIVRKEFLLKNNIYFPTDVPGQDLVFVYNCLLKAQGICYVNEVIIRYAPRLDGEKQSITAIKNKKNLLGYVKAYFLVSELFRNNPNYFKYIIKHLNFWSEQFITSGLPFYDKLDLLIFASPLFKLISNNKKIKIKKSLKPFYKEVFNENYIEAINLCESVSLNFKDYVWNKIKNKEIFIIINNNYDEIKNRAKWLYDEGFDVTLINLSSDKINTSLNLINVKEDKNISFKKDKIIFSDNQLNFDLNFDDLNNFYNYYVHILCLKSEEEVFLIDLNNILDIDSSIAFIINEINDCCDLKEFLVTFYVKEVKQENNPQLLKTELKKDHPEVKQQNNENLSHMDKILKIFKK